MTAIKLFFCTCLFWLLNQVAGKIVKDSLPDDMSIQTLYTKSTKYLFRLAVVSLMIYSFVSIKLFTPSEKQKLALLGTYVVLMFLIYLNESKGQWKLITSNQEDGLN